MDDGADRCIGHADDFVIGDERAQPVGEMNDFGSGDSGKEILGATGESGDLMWKDRPADEDVVVVENKAIERNRDDLAYQAAGQSRFRARDLPILTNAAGSSQR